MATGYFQKETSVILLKIGFSISCYSAFQLDLYVREDLVRMSDSQRHTHAHKHTVGEKTERIRRHD